ncbi:MAG: tetratricopeptide repeat-containing sensor histidine kinase [Colwellia sp.]|nr:tetratricopeptide repeat-containing sensor histidine kinase [Colwellia sp.]
MRETHPDKAIAYVIDILSQYKGVLNTKQTLRLTYAKALFQITTDEFEAAYATLVQCKNLADKLAEPYLSYYYYSYMGRNFIGLEMYELGLDNYLKSYQVAQTLKNRTLTSQAENNLGHVLLKLHRLKDAISYFERFYKSAVKHNINSHKAIGLNNLGEVYFEQGKTTLALEKFTESLAINTKNKLTLNTSWSHHNLGKVYLQESKLVLASKHLQQAINTREKYGSIIESLLSKVVLAKVLLAQGHTQSALDLLNIVVTQASKRNSYTAYTQAYQVLKTHYKKVGDLTNAMDASEHFTASKLKLTERKSNLGLSHYIAISELALKKVNIIELQKKNALAAGRAQWQQTKIMLILFFATLIALVMLLFLRKVNKKSRQLKQTITDLHATQKALLEAEKMSAMTTLVSGMAHQLNTPLGVIITANSIIKEKVQKLEDMLINKTLNVHAFKSFIDEAKQTITLSANNSDKAAELVHRFKMISAELEGAKLTSFPLKSFILNKLTLLANLYQKKFIFDIEGHEIELVNYPDVLFEVLEQLVKNTFDHKQEDTDIVESHILIHVVKERVNIIYIDNGPGVDEKIREKIFNPFFTTKGMQKNLGLGLNVAYNAVHHLMQGKLSCEHSAVGAKFIISLPIIIEHESND